MGDQIILAGAVEPEEMPAYYAEADGYIMPSKAEGLSISALEAISFGKPVILFNDSECIEELSDEKVVCVSESRSDLHFAESIRTWNSTVWDAEYIREFAHGFTMEEMAEAYLHYYRNRLTPKQA